MSILGGRIGHLQLAYQFFYFDLFLPHRLCHIPFRLIPRRLSVIKLVFKSVYLFIFYRGLQIDFNTQLVQLEDFLFAYIPEIIILILNMLRYLPNTCVPLLNDRILIKLLRRFLPVVFHSSRHSICTARCEPFLSQIVSFLQLGAFVFGRLALELALVLLQFFCVHLVIFFELCHDHFLLRFIETTPDIFLPISF